MCVSRECRRRVAMVSKECPGRCRGRASAPRGRRARLVWPIMLEATLFSRPVVHKSPAFRSLRRRWCVVRCCGGWRCLVAHPLTRLPPTCLARRPCRPCRACRAWCVLRHNRRLSRRHLPLLRLSRSLSSERRPEACPARKLGRLGQLLQEGGQHEPRSEGLHTRQPRRCTLHARHSGCCSARRGGSRRGGGSGRDR